MAEGTKIFSEIQINGKTVKNRVVLPPMVCFYDDADDGFANPRNVAHYEELAKGGVGAVIVEATCVSPFGKLHKCQLGLWDDKFIPGLSQIAEAIKKHGALSLIQIQHAGLRTVRESCELPLAPSDYDGKPGRGRAMSREDIERTRSEFARAAARAKAAGFDGVEIHGCHAYLISQFLSPSVNVRQDEYGRDKAKFGVEVAEAVRAATGDSFIVGMRTSGNDPDMETSIRYARAFEGAGCDYLHVSTGFTNNKPADMTFDEDAPNNWIAQLSGEIKKHVSVPVIAVNGIKTPEQAKDLIENGRADLAAVGRGLWADPLWVEKARRGEPVDACLGCAKCGCFISKDHCVKRKGGA